MLLNRKNIVFAVVLLVVLALLSCFPIHAKEVIIFSGTWNPGQPQVETQNLFKKLLEDKSNGKFEVRVISGGAMGGAREHLEACRDGELHLLAIGPEATAIFNPTYDVENIPFVFEDWEHLYAYLDGEPGDIIKQKVMETLNIRILGTQIRGPRLLTARKPIYSADDLHGIKMRLSETAPLIRIWGAVGASVVPIAFNELYSALQTNIVSAQENPIETIYGQKFYEVQDYLMETNHILSISYFEASEKWFSSLSEDDQKLIVECMDEAIEYGNNLAIDAMDTLKQEMIDEGWLTFIPMSEIDVESIRKPALEEINKMVEEGEYNRELFEMALSLKK